MFIKYILHHAIYWFLWKSVVVKQRLICLYPAEESKSGENEIWPLN